MTRRVVMVLLVLLASCGVEGEARKAIVESCIPPEYRVTAPGWVLRSSDLTETGPGFAGCWRNESIRDCVLPKTVVGGGVYHGDAPKRVLGDMPANSFYRQVSLDKTSSTIRGDSRGTLIVENPTLSDKWLIWESKSDYVSSRIGELDELSAVCGYSQVVRNGIYEKEVICERIIEGSDYYVKSQFWSPTRIPSNLLALDQELLSVLGGWGCLKPSSKH